jgi:hypothetical protein
MGMKKKRGRPPRADKRATDETGPTPETIAKLEVDVLTDLVETGLITVDQECAGREINAVWEALERSMARTSATFLMRVTASHRELPDAVSHAIAWRLHYRHQPWASREIEKKLAPGVTRYGVVWRLCNLNWPIDLIARQAGVSEARILRAVRDSLDVYISFAKKCVH